jgi:hypothetical protein
METAARAAYSRNVMNETPASEVECRHHWLLGQPGNGNIEAVCRKCGLERRFPAVLDDLDPGIESDSKRPHVSVATAAGGARPSSVAPHKTDKSALSSVRGS